MLYKLASLLHCSVSCLLFTYGAWPSTGGYVVRALALHIHLAKIKAVKISSAESGGIFAKILHHRKFSAIQYTTNAIEDVMSDIYRDPPP